MNHLFFLPRDLQRLLARYLIPLTLSTKPDTDKRERDGPAVCLFQELTGQSFPSLLEWATGKSIIQRPFSEREVTWLLFLQQVKVHAEFNIRLTLLLGLPESLVEQIPDLPVCLNKGMEHGGWFVSREMLIHLLKIQQLELTERVALQLDSLTRLQRYFARAEKPTLSWSNFIYSQYLYPAKQLPSTKIFNFYLDHADKMEWEDFRNLIDSQVNKSPVHLPRLVEKVEIFGYPGWHKQRELEQVFLLFAGAVLVQPAADYVGLDKLYFNFRQWLTWTEWDQLFVKCMNQLHCKQAAPIDPLIYYCFYQLYFQTRQSPANYYEYRKHLTRLPNYAEVQAVLEPLFVRALASGVIRNNKHKNKK